MDRRELEAECNEQARLNGMGAEREARMMAQVAELQAKVNDLARHLCLSAEREIATNRHVYQLEIERIALAKDAARYRWIAADHSLAWEEEIDAAMSEGER